MIFIRLLQAEFKSLVYRLPKIILGGSILGVVILLFVFVITEYSYNNDSGKNVIAISASDDIFTETAITAVENMKSVSKICKFVRVNENEAEAMVWDNRASAAIIFGQNFVEDILRGKNTQPRILVNENSSKLFTELTQCGSSMLAIVQAGIYSAEAVYYDTQGKRLSPLLNRELNMEYINTVFSREKIFRELKNDGISLGEYYLAMLLSVFMLFLTMSFSAILFSQNKVVYEYSGLSWVLISIIQFLKAFAVLMFTNIIVWILCMVFDINIHFTLMPVITIALFSTTVFSISGKNKVNGSLFIMVFTLAAGFFGGAFIPPAFMNEKIRALSELTPLNVMGMEFMGNENVLYSLIVWGLCLAVIFVGGKRK